MNPTIIAALIGLSGVIAGAIVAAIASTLSTRSQKPPDISKAIGEIAKDVPNRYPANRQSTVRAEQ
jgi:hypothetical protein